MGGASRKTKGRTVTSTFRKKKESTSGSLNRSRPDSGRDLIPQTRVSSEFRSVIGKERGDDSHKESVTGGFGLVEGR